MKNKKTQNRIIDSGLMSLANSISKEYYDGHLTILYFTTGMIFAFGTVTDREEIYECEAYQDINYAVIAALHDHNREQVNEKKDILWNGTITT